MKKTFTFNADKERHLRFNTNSLIELEDTLGKPLSSFENGNASFKDLRTIIYIGFKWEDKKLTVEKTGEIMDMIIENEGIGSLSEKMGEAIAAAVGQGTPFKK